MSHTLFTTNGIVLASRQQGEANKILSIFTRDIGLIEVTSQSLRSLTSKLRFHTQLFSHSNFTCVRSKKSWRLVGAESISDFIVSSISSEHNAFSLQERTLFARISNVIRAYIHGEEPNLELYSWLIEIMYFCNANLSLNKEDKSLLEILSIAKILFLLGYIDYPILKEITLTDCDKMRVYTKHKASLVSSINGAFYIA